MMHKSFIGIGLLAFALLLTGAMPVYAFEAWDEEENNLLVASDKAVLRSEADIMDKYVYLGDLFDGVGVRAMTKVMAAPAAGHEITLNADELMRVAQSNQLEWRPAEGERFIKIKRKGVLISEEEISAKVKEALANHKELSGEWEINFSASRMEFFAPVGKNYEIIISDVSYNRRNGQFIAALRLEAEDAEDIRARLTGKVVAVLSAPVLNRDIAQGETINVKDLDFAKVRRDVLRSRDLLKVEEIAGKNAKKSLKAGDLVASDDILQNYEVIKGKSVTVQLKIKNMALTAQAKALENGIRGDAIKVVNPSSKQTFLATVAGPNLVVVEPHQAKM